jgi:hypothetical protein
MLRIAATGIRFHGRPNLRAEDILRRDDIPATSPSRTLSIWRQNSTRFRSSER